MPSVCRYYMTRLYQQSLVNLTKYMFLIDARMTIKNLFSAIQCLQKNEWHA